VREHVEHNRESYNDHVDDWVGAMETNVGHIYLEKPAMEAVLPEDLSGKSVLCVGVGSGDELSCVKRRGASDVVGIDVSEDLLRVARGKHPGVTFRHVDMMRASEVFDVDRFDVVYSSLTFHYSQDWDVLLAEMKDVLVDGGLILVSTHHPGYWGRNPTGGEAVNDRGVCLTEHEATLPGGVDILYYNHPSTESVLEAFEHAGFTVLEGFAPSVVDVENPDLPGEYAALRSKNADTPLFFIVKATA
jgi:SAM-dependent methyltransferase